MPKKFPKMPKLSQRFTLYAPVDGDVFGKAYEVEEDLWEMDDEEVYDKFQEYIERFDLDPKGKYIAVGSNEDSVHYDNGNIYCLSADR